MVRLLDPWEDLGGLQGSPASDNDFMSWLDLEASLESSVVTSSMTDVSVIGKIWSDYNER